MDILKELVEVQKDLTSAREVKARFPSKAFDLNKLEDRDGFWDLDIKDAKRLNGLRFNPSNMGDIIFFLNMVAAGWEENGYQEV